jgi:uncharacterized membrane protein (UPF0127 family)
VRAFLVVGLVVASVACTADEPLRDRPGAVVRFAGTDAVLAVDVADTPAERRRGLMGVEHLPRNGGMAFVFRRPVSSVFWMKDTLIPLSIAFVDEQGEIVTIRDMEPCRSDACPRYAAARPYVLAVEANRGWYQEHGVRVGDRAELEVMAHR